MIFSDIFPQRRAVNFFDPNRSIPDALLRKMIELASYSPSSFNLQPWSLMVVTDTNAKSKLQKLAMNQPKVSEAPVTMIVLADKNGWKDENSFVKKNYQEMIKAGTASPDDDTWYRNARKNLYGQSPETELAFACKNTGFFAMSLMFAAQSLGLSTHPMDGFDQEGVKTEFNIPDNFWIPLLLAVGYFDTSRELPPPKWRKTCDEIIVSF